MTILWPLDGGHADLTLSGPDARSLTDAFTPLEEKPLTTSIPFTLDDGFASACREAADAWLTSPEWIEPLAATHAQDAAFSLRGIGSGLAKLFTRKSS